MRPAFARTLLCAGLMTLLSCDSATFSSRGVSDSLDPRSQYLSVPAADAWVNVPKSALVVERQRGADRAQRVLLPNHSYLPGDNVIYLRAIRNRPSGSIGAFDLESMLEFIGGVPRPFTSEELATLRSRQDAAGTLTWGVWTDGAGTTCVLALRRLTEMNRILPFRSNAVDMLLRNCVRGTEEDALAPADPQQVAFPTIGRNTPASPQTLSPLAAPLP
jgi:hypothetical protein